ncbi:hypothetical protein FACS1894188_01700 [Clostridia bacterium]|nr:hypothetical protein FACS1894188_01700 [Clostridia bacterium]
MNPSSSPVNTTTEIQNEQSNFADILLQFKTIAQNSGIDLNAVMSAISQTPGEVTAPAPIPNAVNSGANGVILPMDSFALHEAELCCYDISTSFSRLSSLIGNMSGPVSGIAPRRLCAAPKHNYK